MTFTELKEKDVHIITELNREFNDGWNGQMLLSGFNGGRLTAIGVIEDGETVGYITYSTAIDEADIETVLVKSEYRRRGIATALIEKAESDLKRKGITKLFLEVRKSNQNAVALYLKSGFNNISVRKKYYADGEDALVLVKELI